MKRFIIGVLLALFCTTALATDEQVIRGDLTVRGDINTTNLVNTGNLTINGIFTVNPDATNEVFQVNDGTIDFTDGNAGTTGTLTVDASGNWSYSKDVTVAGGDLAVGVAATEPGDIVQHDAGTTTYYDDGNNTSVVIGPVVDGTNDLPIAGDVIVKGPQDTAATLNFYADEGDDAADKIAMSMSAAGVFSIQPSADSTTGIQILDTDGGTPIVNIDTTNERVGIGTSTPQNILTISHSSSPTLSINRKDDSISDTNQIGALRFTADDGATEAAGASIAAVAKADWSAGDYPTELIFYTAPDGSTLQQRMVITKDGNVGIGTTGPSYILETSTGEEVIAHFHSTDDRATMKLSDDDTESYISTSNGNLYFAPSSGTLANAKLLIGDTGNVGIGTTSPATKLDQAQFSADAVGSYHTFSKSRNATAGSHTIVQDNDVIGGINFAPSDGTDFGTISAQIKAEVDDSAPAASSIGGALTFSTAAGAGADDLTERVRIDKSGNTGIGQTTFGTSAAKVLAIGSGTAPTTSPADAAQLWSADHNSAAGYARLYQRTEDGLSGPVAQLAEVTAPDNTKAPSQGVHMTAASSGSTGITVGDDDDIDFGTGDFTLVWRGALPDWTPSSSSLLYIKREGGSGTYIGLNAQVTTSGYINLQMLNEPAGLSVSETSDVVVRALDGQPMEIVIVVDRNSGGTGTVTFYANRNQLGTQQTFTDSGDTISNSSTTYISGTSAARTASDTYFAAVYNRALTAAEVKTLYENGIDYADKYGAQAETMPNQVDRDFSGASAWANVDINAYDETDDLTITASAVAQYCTLVAASAPMTYGKKYRLKFDVANLVSTWTVKDFTGTITIGTVSADGANSFEFTNTSSSVTGGFRLIAVGDTSSGDFDNFSLYQIGATGAWEPEGVRNDGWQDSSTNGLDASYPTAGSSLIRPIPTTNGAILLSATTVSLAADADTTLYTVPTGKRCVLSHAILVAGADAVSTDISIGADGAETDFVSAYQCDNLDAANDAIDIRPVPNSTPAKIKSYAAGTVIQAKVENHAGGATNTLYLFGFLY